MRCALAENRRRFTPHICRVEIRVQYLAQMKLKIRTLKNVEVEVDINLDATLFELKQKIEKALPHMEATKQMLIHQGKILSDTVKISEYPNIKENDKLVVMVPKVF